MKPNHDIMRIPFIRELCRNRSEEEIREAEQTFRRYLRLVRRICERLEREEVERQKLDKNEL